MITESPMILIRQAVYTAIETARDAGLYTLGKEWSLDWAYMPYTELPDMDPKGQVWVLGLAADDEQKQSRANLTQKEIPVQVALQKLVGSPDDKEHIDRLILMEEQLRWTVRKAVDITEEEFSWIRTESLKDDEGTPFSFMGLREGNVFEAYFTAYFRHVME